MKNWRHMLLTLGITICIICSYLMAFGEPIVGADHAGIATMVGIVGIGAITAANTTLILGAKEEK